MAVEWYLNDRFLVFCHDNQDPNRDLEDKAWVSNFLDTFIKGRWEFWTPKSDTDDLNAMTTCEGIIGANSTYSWWAAFLNPLDVKTVFPKQWFKDGIERCMMPPEWITI